MELEFGCEESDGTNVYDKTRRREDRNGIFFMEAFMDEVHVYSKEGEGTKVIMTKKMGEKNHLNG